MSELQIPEDLQEWYKTLDESRENTAACSCAEICRLIERISALEAENKKLDEGGWLMSAEIGALTEERDEFKQKFESMCRINDANLESYNNCAIEARRLKAPVSDEEWEFLHERGSVPRTHLGIRAAVSELIAARAKESV